MRIRILSDGKQGHLNQSLGLAHALIEKVGGSVETIPLHGLSFLDKIRTVVNDDTTKPDLFISAGHATHIPLICARQHFKSKVVLCMKPTLPLSFFDLCLIPKHDLSPDRDYTDTNIFPTWGALHPIRPDSTSQKDIVLVLIGGPSKDFDWDTEELLNQLATISIHTPGKIILTTSRRTPQGVADKIKEAIPEIITIPVEETQPGWVAQHLARANAVWVSRDSVSMVYEALGSAAPVGIISVPQKSNKRQSRILSGLNMLTEAGFVTTFDSWVANNYTLLTSSDPLLEADRAAEFILTRLFNNTL